MLMPLTLSDAAGMKRALSAAAIPKSILKKME
jgi:hypothetical protein